MRHKMRSVATGAIAQADHEWYLLARSEQYFASLPSGPARKERSWIAISHQQKSNLTSDRHIAYFAVVVILGKHISVPAPRLSSLLLAC